VERMRLILTSHNDTNLPAVERIRLKAPKLRSLQ
jgi:hypothetical protein